MSIESDDMQTEDVKLAELKALCKRRGIVIQGAEIYGGMRGVYDYGPTGVELLRNVKNQWWKTMVHGRHDVVGLDASILSPPAVWAASGHLDNFTDPLADCTKCQSRHRIDNLEVRDTCPTCGATGSFTDEREFNLMFKTQAGPVADSANDVYLRPETAQGQFVNFGHIQYTSRKKPPFGIAQIGKSFRNEITPGNFVFRTREFEQMEMEFFVPPEEAEVWHKYWLAERMKWYVDLGISAESLRLRPHDADELSHYSSGTSDVEFLFPWGWGELEGIANRGNFDLTQHASASGAKLEYFDQETGRAYVPHVIEPAAGATRAMMAFLLAAYEEEDLGDGDTRTVLRLDPRLSPFKVAVLPLSKKDALPALAMDIFEEVATSFVADYDDTQSIGKRYRRQDEIGTPYCVTVDFDSGADQAVTVRDRDTMRQTRVAISRLVEFLGDKRLR